MAETDPDAIEAEILQLQKIHSQTMHERGSQLEAMYQEKYRKREAALLSRQRELEKLATSRGINFSDVFH